MGSCRMSNARIHEKEGGVSSGGGETTDRGWLRVRGRRWVIRAGTEAYFGGTRVVRIEVLGEGEGWRTKRTKLGADRKGAFLPIAKGKRGRIGGGTQTRHLGEKSGREVRNWYARRKE